MDTELLQANLVIESRRLAKRRKQRDDLAKRYAETQKRLGGMETKLAEVDRLIAAKETEIEVIETALRQVAE